MFQGYSDDDVNRFVQMMDAMAKRNLARVDARIEADRQNALQQLSAQPVQQYQQPFVQPMQPQYTIKTLYQVVDHMLLNQCIKIQYQHIIMCHMLHLLVMF